MSEPKWEARSLRPRDEAPFCWFSRAALDRIETSPAITNQARAKLVYAAGHVVEASRQGKPTYRAPKALIARNAGVSVRTVTEANAELAAAGLLLIEKQFDGERKQYDMSTYTLCTFRTTPGAKKRADNLPNSKGNFTLQESEISKEKVPPIGPGAHPAPVGGSREPGGAAKSAQRPVVNTW